MLMSTRHARTNDNNLNINPSQKEALKTSPAPLNLQKHILLRQEISPKKPLYLLKDVVELQKQQVLRLL